MQGKDIGIIDEREAVIPCVRYIPIRGNLCEKPGEKTIQFYTVHNRNHTPKFMSNTKN